jgi:hypothetical protein
LPFPSLFTSACFLLGTFTQLSRLPAATGQTPDRGTSSSTPTHRAKKCRASIASELNDGSGLRTRLGVAGAGGARGGRKGVIATFASHMSGTPSRSESIRVEARTRSSRCLASVPLAAAATGPPTAAAVAAAAARTMVIRVRPRAHRPGAPGAKETWCRRCLPAANCVLQPGEARGPAPPRSTPWEVPGGARPGGPVEPRPSSARVRMCRCVCLLGGSKLWALVRWGTRVQGTGRPGTTNNRRNG